MGGLNLCAMKKAKGIIDQISGLEEALYMELRHWNPLNWETCLGKLEPAYQKYFLKTDVAQIRFTSLMSIVLSLYFIRADHLFFGYTRGFYALLFLRGVYFAIGVLILLRLSKPLTPDQFRVIMIIQLGVAIIFMSVINITRPRSYIDYSAVNMIFLFSAYLFNSLQVKLRFGGAFLFTVIEFINLNTKTNSNDAWFILASSYVFVNAVGFILAVWFVNNRRQQFKIWYMERQYRKKVEKLSNLDALTGIKNRRFFLTRGSSEVKRAIHFDRPLSLAIIDIDGLKDLNDRHGHLSGDKALRAFVKSFKANIRRQDIFARLGGDEFGLLMPETDFSDAQQLINRVKLDLNDRPLKVNGSMVHMTFSAGLAESKCAHSLIELVRIADKKLYQAKNGGRNRVVS